MLCGLSWSSVLAFHCWTEGKMDGSLSADNSVFVSIFDHH